jgi:hypothetical protein
MADSNTETTAAAESPVQKGSEFSKPTGAGDDALWEKHFGKDAKEPKGKAASSKPSPKSESGSKSKGSTGEKTPSSSSTSKSTADSSEKSPKPKDSKADASSSKSKDSKDAKDSTESTGRKTAEEPDDKTPADPEAPSKKARDLFAEAKKAEDPREARKLYKRAMKEAFGEVPEEFDDAKYLAVRKDRKARDAAIEEKAQKNDARFKEAVEKLKPAIYVMRQLEGSGLADKLTVPMVEKALHVMKALKGLEDGDFTQLAEVVSRAAGVDADEAMKRFVRGVKVSPEGRAARQQAEQTQRDNQALKDRLAQLERQLQERESTQTEAQKKQERERAQQENRARWIDDISSELDGHAALKLPRGAERVLAYLIRTANPQTKAPRYSFEEAANRIVASEKKRLQGARHLLEDGEAPAPRTETRRLSSVSRAETADTGIRNPDPEARFSEIFDKHAAGGRRR